MGSGVSEAPRRTYAGVEASERVAGRRAAFLGAGLEVFGTTGFAQARVKDVCSAAGLSTRYFYESFSGLDELFRAVHLQVVDELQGAVADAAAAAAVDAEGDADTILHAAIDAFVAPLSSDPGRRRILFTEAAAVDEATRVQSRQALRRFADLVAGMARRGLPSSVPEARIEVLALSIVGTMDHVMAEWLTGSLDLGVDELVTTCARQFAASVRDLADDGSG